MLSTWMPISIRCLVANDEGSFRQGFQCRADFGWLPMKSPRYLEVFIAGSHAGELRMSNGGALSFAYDRSYAGPDLSACMPFSSEEYTGRRVCAWFDNLLPDDGEVRRGMASSAGVTLGIFSLLSFYGLDLPGAVQVVPLDAVGEIFSSGGYVAVSSDHIGRRLEGIVSSEKGNLPRSWTCRSEHWSLGGMQTKLALREYAGQWFECVGSGASNVIVKPGIWSLESQALDECVTMRLAKLCGLPVADARMESFGGVPAVVLRRYDRFTNPANGEVIRIHQEDLCQATATMSSQKYAADGGPSSFDVMMLLEGVVGASRTRFVDALLFNYLTASTDAHAKNYSLLHPRRGEYLLAPLYDLASAAPYMEKGKMYRLAMSIGGENRVGWLRKSNLARFAKLHGLQTADLSLRVDELSELIKGNLEEALNGFAGCSGIDELACRLIPRIRVLCDAAQKNIRVDAARFEPVDISRLR